MIFSPPTPCFAKELFRTRTILSSFLSDGIFISCLAWERAHPATATRSLRPPPSPGSKTRPTPPPLCARTAAFAFAFCFLCSGAPTPARALQGTQRAPPVGPGKASERALALARRTPPPPRARARAFGRAPAPPGGREGRWQLRLQEGRTSSLVYPWKVDLEREAGRRRGSATRVRRRLRAAMWGAVPRWV